MRKTIVGAALLLSLVVGSGTALAASPGTGGQPSQSCGGAGATSIPSGFNTGGFARAETVYAGSDGTPSSMNGNPAAVSQYDVACFELTSAGR